MGETHELLIKPDPVSMASAGKTSPDVKTGQDGPYLYVQWKTTGDKQFVVLGNLFIYLLGEFSHPRLLVPTRMRARGPH
jgi:hypothetical protein